MSIYRYTDSTNTVVHIVDDDGISRSSCLASVLPEGTEILPADPVVVPVPTEVTMRQARLALLQTGKFSAVEVSIGSLPEPQKTAALIEWDYSNTVQRNNSFTANMIAMLGMTGKQADDLFRLAATL